MIDVKISTFKHAKNSTPTGMVDFMEYLSKIKSGFWQDIVLGVRAGTQQKDQAPAVTCSGVFTERLSTSLVKHSGILAIDIDKADNDHLDLLDVMESLKESEYVFAFHRSIRGFGYVVYVKVKPDKHLDSFLFIEKAFANDFNIIIDKTCKDVSRLRFVSYDPDLYINDSAKVLRKFLPKKETTPIVKRDLIFLDSDIKSITDQIRDGKINICETYHEWMCVGFSISSGFGEKGEDLFHVVSSQSAKYNEIDCSKKYKNFVSKNNGDIPVDYFFNICEKNGIEVVSKTTKRKVDKIKLIRSDMPKDTKESIKSVMISSHDLSTEDDFEILDKVMKLPHRSLIISETNRYITEIESILKEHDIKYNEVTGMIEIDGATITDLMFNKMYISLLKSIDEKFSKEIVYSIMDYIAPSYNSLTSWFQKNKHLYKEEEEMWATKELLECFESGNRAIDETTGKSETMRDFHIHFIPRWLCGIVSSAHGTYSLLILVLCGGQNVGKTEFFKSILPEEIRGYCAMSKLDREKDDEVLMTQKLILYDDEFGGKSKRDEKKLKALSSIQGFSLRKAFRRNHEDIQRIAVLGGTSNEEMVINDVTGNRRIIPVNVTKFDIERFKKIDKDRLWAEVYYQWSVNKNEWMLNADTIKLLNASTVDNKDVSVEEELILRYFKPKEKDAPGKSNEDREREDKNYENMTTTDIASYLTKVSDMKLSLKRLGIILKKSGFEPVSKKVNGKSLKVYRVLRLDPSNSDFNKVDVDIKEDNLLVDPIISKNYKETIKERGDIISDGDEPPF